MEEIASLRLLVDSRPYIPDLSSFTSLQELAIHIRVSPFPRTYVLYLALLIWLVNTNRTTQRK